MTLSIEDATRFAQVFKGLVDGVSVAVLDKRQAVRLALTTMFAGGHLLLEDAPGTGKTALARAISAVIDGTHSRIQFTPDLLPSDITGVNMFNQKTGEWVFHAGPVFAEIVLADEINRASPKLQSALLEAMEEKQVSVDGRTYRLPKPFIVVATQNPTEQLSTFPLPESQLDRFMMRLSLGYPSAEAERQLYAQGDRRQLLPALKAVCNAEILLQWQAQAAQVKCSQQAADYVYRLVQSTRQPGLFVTGLSPRAGLAVVNAAKAWAFMHGRGHVLPDDIKAVWISVTNHRLRPLQQGGSSTQLLNGILNHVAVQ